MGDNLVEFLTTLKTSHTDSFRRIEQVVRDTFPDVEELIPQLTQYGQVFLSAREKFLQKPVTVWNMADGELVFIALLALIFSPPELGAPVVCVEEPENHLHPRLLETLVEVLRQNENVLQAEGVPPSQLFATTHSPYLVDQWGLDELLVFEKVNGETRISRPRDKEHLRKLLSQEKLGLGELWYSGALGGV
jgi:predicted ATPase